MAGLKNCPQIGGKIDGVSIVPLLKSKPGYPKDRSIFWHLPHKFASVPYSSIRKGAWKLIYFHTDSNYKLYSLKDDIGETTNLISTRKDIAQRLADELRLFMIDAGAQMPTNKSSGKPVPLPGIL